MELEFGNKLGEHFEEPVLLIKTAWGGHSLYKKFRPPSAGLPSEAALAKELETARKRIQASNEKHNKINPVPSLDEITDVYGISYRNMVVEVRDTLENYERLFPALKGRVLRLPVLSGSKVGTTNTTVPNKHMLRICNVLSTTFDVSLPIPNCRLSSWSWTKRSQPAKGPDAGDPGSPTFHENVPEFRGTVAAVRTDQLVDRQAEKLFPNWRDNLEVWRRTGSDFAYHYLGSAIGLIASAKPQVRPCSS